jgi:hypothetical protein
MTEAPAAPSARPLAWVKNLRRFCCGIDDSPGCLALLAGWLLIGC